MGGGVVRGMDRREFLRLGGVGLAGAALLGVAGCGGGAQSGQVGGGGGGREVVFASSGGSYQEAQTEAWLQPFSEETGVRVIQDTPNDTARLRAMVENEQVSWDVVNVGSDFGLESTAHLLEPLDYSVIDRRTIRDGYATDHRVALSLGAFVLGYNTDQMEGTPSGWADFFDLEKFPGKRGVRREPIQNLEVTLLGDGVALEDLYPLDVERALRKLDTIREDIIFWEEGSQMQQLLADGEVVMSQSYISRVVSSLEDGAPLEIQWNGNLANADYAVVPKGAPNKERAMELIAYMVAPENNWQITNHLAVGPSQTQNLDKIDPEVAELLPTTGDRRSEGVGTNLNSQWWDENGEATTERFNEWLLG